MAGGLTILYRSFVGALYDAADAHPIKSGRRTLLACYPGRRVWRSVARCNANEFGRSCAYRGVILDFISGHLARPATACSAHRKKVDWSKVRTTKVAYFPGRAEGYVGYPDYVVMNVTINDSSLDFIPQDQFGLVGFGYGFSKEMLARAAREMRSSATVYQTLSASLDDEKSFGWLARMQRLGVDNAGYSTSKLRHPLSAIGRGMCECGPIIVKYWDRYHEKMEESEERSGTSDRRLSELRSIYALAVEQGIALARDASIDDLDRNAG